MQRESRPPLVEPPDARRLDRMRSASGAVAEDVTSAPTTRSTADTLLGLVSELLIELRPGSPPRRVRLDDSIERDLGLDSLSRAELALRIERTFRVRLPEDVWVNAGSLRDLLAAFENLDGTPGGATLPPSATTLLPEVSGAPDQAATILQAFHWNLERHPEREHITLLMGDERFERLSYAQLFGDATTMAAGLVASAVVQGDRVALMLPTSAAFFQVFLGAMLIGAVPVPLYPPYRWSQIEDHVRGRSAILANCGAVLLVTVPEAQFVGRVARAESPALQGVISPERLHERGAGAASLPERACETALLQYTSGSTGDPKGVVLTHANLLANIRAMGRAATVTSRDRFVSWLPLYHDMGLIGAWLATMYHAVPLVIMPPASFLGRPARWLRTIHRFRGTISAAPNFAYEIAASKIPDEDLEGLDLTSWRLAFNGAEPVRTSTLVKFTARFERYGFDARALLPVYGLAESGVGLAFPPLDRKPLIERIDSDALARDGIAVLASESAQRTLEAVSCGSPLPGHEIRIVDESGSELPSRAEGRIEFRGPSATAGYFNNAEATRKLLRGSWLDTGDAGYIANGELFVTSRIKDLIKRGGHTLHPYDLEAAIGDLPGVRKGCVAVFGTADPTSGTERVIVVAETRDTDAASRDTLRGRITELATVHLGGPADEVLLVPPHTVLKTSSGKIRRSACRELYERRMLDAPRRRIATQISGLLVRVVAAHVRRSARASARTVYGLYASTLVLLAAIVGVVLLALIPGVHRRQCAARMIARAVLHVACVPLEIRGPEHLPIGRPVVVAANHSSYADAIVLAAALPLDIHWAAKSEFASVPLLGFVMRRLGTHFVARHEALRGIEDTRTVAAAVGRGETVGFFPEGTFSRVPGVAPFRLGAFAVAAETRTPVVPVILSGTRSLLREGRWLPERHKVTVSVEASLMADGQDWSSAVRLRDATRAVVLTRCGEPDLAS